uniref:Uncharacterized protein n=1 Tax=Romanomermis culicivorax TaxID=13658 RepID=A0A915K3Z5_ROMCU
MDANFSHWTETISPTSPIQLLIFYQSIVAVPRVHSLAAPAIDAKSFRSTKSKTRKFREMATAHRKNVILTKRIRPTVLNEKRKIFDYWIHPIEYHDMLNDMWKKT